MFRECFQAVVYTWRSKGSSDSPSLSAVTARAGTEVTGLGGKLLYM